MPRHLEGELPLIVVLDQIKDPQNFGQIIRTAECAGINGILFPQHHSVPITQTVLQVSQGAFVNMSLYQLTNLSQGFEELKKNDFWIIGLENSIDANAHEINIFIRDGGKTEIIVSRSSAGLIFEFT